MPSQHIPTPNIFMIFPMATICQGMIVFGTLGQALNLLTLDIHTLLNGYGIIHIYTFYIAHRLYLKRQGKDKNPTYLKSLM